MSLSPDEWMRAASAIEPYADGTYQLAEDGPLAHFIPVETWDEQVFDIVAFYPSAPQRWWRRRGLATVLGDEALHLADWTDQAIGVFETPRQWLSMRAAGDSGAVCILDWTFDPRDVFRPGFKVICHTIALEDRLKRRYWEVARPQFKILGPPRRRAA